MNKKDVSLLNGIALAYIGDAAYETFIREHLLNLGITKAAQLQKLATNFVSAKGQAKIFSRMAEEKFLTDEEMIYFKRGRNAHSKTTAKNTDVITYRISTGFEAVIGFLHMCRENDRLNEIITYSIQTIETIEAENV